MEWKSAKKNPPGEPVEKPANTGALLPADSLPASEENKEKASPAPGFGEIVPQRMEGSCAEKEPAPGHPENGSGSRSPRRPGGGEEGRARSPESLLGWEDVLEN